MNYNDRSTGNNEEFCWNTIDFPKPKKLQDIEMDWSGKSKRSDAPFMTADASEGFVPKAGKAQPIEDVAPKAQQPQSNLQSTIQAQPQAQQTPYVANPQMGWTMPSSAWTMPAQQQVVVPQPYNVVPPQMPVAPVVQPLYVTQPVPVIQPGVMPAQMTAAYQTMGMPTFQQPAQTTDVYKWLDKEIEDSRVSPSKDQFFTFSKKNQDFQKLLDEEYARYKTKYDTNATSLNIQVAEALKKQSKQIDEEVKKEMALAMAPATDKTVVYDAKAQHAFPQRPLDTTLFNKEPVTDFDKMIMEGTKDASAVGEATLAISNEELRREIDEVAQKVEAAYTTKPQLKAKSSEPKFDTKFEQQLIPSFDPKFETEDIVLEKPARKPVPAYQIREYDENKRQKDLESMAAAREAFFKPQEDDLDKTSAVEIKSIFDQWDQEHKAEEEKKNKKKKKGGFGKFLLILLLLIALFVAADFAAITFYPEDPIGEFFFGVNDKAEEFYNLALEKIGKGKEKEDPDEELTAQDKAVKEVNTNIIKVVCDPTSPRYSTQGDYGYNNLGSTSTVEDEQKIIDVSKVLVQYNCAWIDYVNTGDDISCYEYLTTDGEAFKSASSFDGVGKLTETFKKLNIGEVREDSKYVYIFADELISVKNGNEITEVPQSLIYRMTLVGDNYKIVDYSAYN